MVNHIFEKFLNEKTASFDSYMAEFFGEGTHPDMWRYLYGPLSEFSNNAGKRHRPLICMLACRAVGGDDQMARAAGAAIEHFHTAALIHDDIADESQLRRGKPCLHHQIGEGLAINAGDLALSLVTGTVLVDDSLSDAVKLRVLKELVDMTTRTIEGQALDIGWARDERFDITVEDYLTMAAHKTAFYSGGVPLAVGAIIGGGSEEQIETLRAYGMSTGLAFQIQDDLLNLVGTEEATRKDFRGDITEGKRTLVVVHALEHAQGTTSSSTSSPRRRPIRSLSNVPCRSCGRRGRSTLPVRTPSSSRMTISTMSRRFFPRLPCASCSSRWAISS